MVRPQVYLFLKRQVNLMLQVNPLKTALVLIDLQKGIIGRELFPYTAEQVVQNAKGLAESFRAVGAPVVLVNVGFSKDFSDALRQEVDQPFPSPPAGLPANFMELADGLVKPGDILVTKRQWGAFYGTELDLQLRRRGIQTIVLGGIATNMGVESTARQAWEHGYTLIIAEDVTASLSAEMHNFAFNTIFPRLSRVIKCGDLSFA